MSEADVEREFLLAFGARIRQLRSERGLSQDKLAERADSVQHFISQIEQGERNPSLLTIRALATAFGVSCAELLQNL